jgi:hypothetical protein
VAAVDELRLTYLRLLAEVEDRPQLQADLNRLYAAVAMADEELEATKARLRPLLNEVRRYRTIIDQIADAVVRAREDLP